MSSKASDFYDTDDDLEQVLDDAELAASRPREIEFVESIREKYDEWGMRMFLSEAQQSWLEKLANGG